jgi:hypothetical protein
VTTELQLVTTTTTTTVAAAAAGGTTNKQTYKIKSVGFEKCDITSHMHCTSNST